MRLIDADALPRRGRRGGIVHWKDIENAPTVDNTALVTYLINHMTYVVRCKDCKWHRTSEFYALGNDRVPYETISECLKWHDDVPVDFYCAWGERKQDGIT